MKHKLKPCPVCGCDDIGIWESEVEVFERFYVYCERCDTKTDYCETPEQAVELWNKGEIG